MSPGAAQLAAERCADASAALLGEPEVAALLIGLPGWAANADALEKSFRFQRYARAVAFANLVAWLAEEQDHHPEMQVSYGEVRLRFSTHSAGGITRKDFICAAKLEALLATA
jgi:4a-hydroxytetrahydrobiopterin dehydratase